MQCVNWGLFISGRVSDRALNMGAVYLGISVKSRDVYVKVI